MMRPRLLSWPLLLAAAACATTPPAPPPAPAEQARVAITIDDLPFVGGLAPGDTREAATDRLVAALRRHQAPVTAFVTCRGLEKDGALLDRWTAPPPPVEGKPPALPPVVFGHHSTSHRSLNEVPVAQWLEDVRSCGEAIAARPAGSRWFRYPFLQQGKERPVRDQAAEGLKGLGYRVGQVTIDTADWQYAQVYAAALARGDQGEAERIAADYVDHIRMAAKRYRTYAREKLGRDVPHVLLLHANGLNADHLGRVLQALQDMGFGFITLEEAQADPVYAQEERYVGPVGLSWLYRITSGDGEPWRWDEAQLESAQVHYTDREVKVGQEFVVRRIAPGSFLVLSPRPFPANALLAEMPDRTLVLVGSPYDGQATKALMRWVRDGFGERQWVAINTHFHLDGSGGNAVLREAQVPVYGSDLIKSLIFERGEEARRNTWQAWAASDPAWAQRIKAAELSAPDKVFPAQQGLTLTYGGERLEVRYPGPGHSPDNMVVWFPDRKLLFGGCLVLGRDRVGYAEDADLARWPASVNSLRKLQPALVVPGHGAVGGPELLEKTARIVASTPRP
jgi:glyoxylase-like metal-dependent hydrolase (beta-lactamase superfamily II)/peptidoglycan/xylan/chitin deacetylase (PgdA/CDA1 family)